MDTAEEELLQAERITSIYQLKSCTSFFMPSGFFDISTNAGKCVYVLFDNCDNDIPHMLASVSVNSDLKVAVHRFVSNEMPLIRVPLSKFNHLLFCDNTTDNVSCLSNVLVPVKSWFDSDETSLTEAEHLKVALRSINHVIENQSPESKFNEYVELLKFVADQLDIIMIKKQGRRYSSNIIKTSFLWQMTSPNLYSKLQELFALPSVR